jgi:hypothetical protein
MKNKTINIYKMLICMAGLILTIVFEMNLIIFIITLCINSLLQSYQLRINGVSSEISQSFNSYFNVLMTFIVLFFLIYFFYTL